MKLYRTNGGAIIEEGQNFFSYEDAAWDELIKRDDLEDHLRSVLARLRSVTEPTDLRAPIGVQEVWGAGVTYMRSREARMEEAKSAGGGDFYDRVYNAPRPELFFKATPHRVVGPGESVAIRDDANWSVPEPELTLLITPNGRITGYTIGNDMSSRDIEGENPLYLPQAKTYARSCALGPCILVSKDPIPRSTEIKLEIVRSGEQAFVGSTSLESMKRELPELAGYLMRNNEFPNGAFLMTGTGIVPPDSFTLHNGDEIRISISGIGTLINRVG